MDAALGHMRPAGECLNNGGSGIVLTRRAKCLAGDWPSAKQRILWRLVWISTKAQQLVVQAAGAGNRSRKPGLAVDPTHEERLRPKLCAGN
jgi:hypothetical protein